MSGAELGELAARGASLEVQREALRDALARCGLRESAIESALARTRDAIGLRATGDAGGRSRLGGSGLLPPGETWPHTPDGRPMTFVAGLDLGELPQLAPLPPDGTLLVYWDFLFHDLERMDFVVATHVLWAKAGTEFEEHVQPSHEEAEPLGPCAVEGFLMPVMGEVDHLRDDLTEDEHDRLYDLLDEIAYPHQLLGTSRDVQGPVLDEVPYWFEQGFPQTRERYDEAELRGEGWLLLAQIDSDDEHVPGLMIGDAGSIYLLIPEADLRTRRFDRVMGIMQCS